MDAQQEAIVKKVQKLFRLAENAGTDAEAQAAALRAREILSKYNLSLQDVEGFTDEECCEQYIIIKKNYCPSHVKVLMAAMAELFSVHGIISGHYDKTAMKYYKKIIFVGVGPDAIIACQTWDFLTWHAKRKAREYKYTSRQQSEYLFYFSHAVYLRACELAKKLKVEVPQETALVPVKGAAITDYTSRHYGELGVAKRAAVPTFGLVGQQGMSDGKKVNLGRQVKSATAQGLPQ